MERQNSARRSAAAESLREGEKEKVTVSYRKASALIKKYNAGYKMKPTEINEILEWVNDFREQMLLESKNLSGENRVKSTFSRPL